MTRQDKRPQKGPLTFPGPADTRGAHTVNMESAYGETENLRFDFDKANSFDDIDVFIDQVIAAIRMQIEKC